MPGKKQALVRMALFSFLFSKKKQKLSDFHCWILIVKLDIWEVFQARAKFLIFGQNGFIFLSFFQNATTNYVRFPLLIYYCKTNHLGGVSGPGENFRFLVRVA